MSLISIIKPYYTTKALKLGLWTIWIYGFLLICLSLYATQLLHSVKVEFRKPSFLHQKGVQNQKTSSSITIFSVLNNFNGSVGERQALAIRSWLGLSPDISIVLFGNDPSLPSFASAFGSRVFVESNIDFSFLNQPFFHSMVERAQASKSNISVLIHPETILFPDFVSTLNYVYELDHDWFLIASSRKVSSFPFNLDETGKQWLKEGGKAISTQKLQEDLVKAGEWDDCKGRTLMAWNNGNLALHMGVLPPFLYGKGLHDQWLINEVYHSNYRFVIDASWTISNFYVHELDEQKPIQSARVGPSLEVGKIDWQFGGNLHLAELYGLFSSRKADFSDLVNLIKCDREFVFVHKENVVYSLEYQSSDSLWKEHITQLRRKKKIMRCLYSVRKSTRNMDCFFKSNLRVTVPLHLSYDLESLLPIVADENKTIVLAIAGYSYKDMLMSWVCRLCSLMIRNYLVCALDDETYEFSVLQGLPVFKDSLAPRNISYNDCHFGTKCFQKVTKSKSRLVLQILKLGYNVILSDVDVYWFKNPIPLLQTFGPAVLAAQSDEFNLTVPLNLPRRLNSGFYFARSDFSTISALEKVVRHAMTSDQSEQPSFYDTLCGQGGSNRIGNDQCWEPGTNLTVQFLDRDLFPNGAYQGLWEKESVRDSCAKKGCYVLHNNWISGRKKKLERQVNSGLWDYDVSSRMCLQNWHKIETAEFS